MKWNIIADSSSDLRELGPVSTDPAITYTTVPFVMTVGSTDYVDDDTLDVEELLAAMDAEKSASNSSCPAPGAWLEAFRTPGNVFAVTISKNLSGSYNSASTAVHMMKEEDPGKKVTIVDSLATGPALVIVIRKLCQYIKEGKTFEEAEAAVTQDVSNSRTVFALCSFNNLIKNGRMPKLVGFMAQKLGFWGIGIASPQGTIDVREKVRGSKKAVASILADLEKRGVPKQYVVISHCKNPEIAELLKEEVLKRWSSVTVEILETRGLDSYYAERKGLIITYL